MLDGDVKPGVFLMLFDKGRLILARGFSFALPHFIFITYTLYHITKYTHSVIIVIFPLLANTHNPTIVIRQSGAKIKYGSYFRIKEGPKRLKCVKGRQ